MVAGGTQRKEDQDRLVDVECKSVKIDCDLRPRTKGLKLELAVGGLCVQDFSTPDTLLPRLIASQLRVSLIPLHITSFA